ncbi:DNA ligase (ATP) [Irineochytrium annulatum]|nr:DNA ligase (ATP) [Irineochytrium annulatum]
MNTNASLAAPASGPSLAVARSGGGTMASRFPFITLCKFFDAIQPAKPKTKKAKLAALLADWRASGDDALPLLRLLLPHIDKDRATYGVKDKTLAGVYLDALSIQKTSEDGDSLLHWRKPKAGLGAVGVDFADVLFRVLEKRTGGAPGSAMSIADVNERLDLLNACDTLPERRDVIRYIATHMSAREQKWLARIILKDLRVGMTENSVFSVWHPEAMEMFNVTSSLARVARELLDPNVSYLQRGITLNEPFRPMLSKSCKSLASVERLMKGTTFWIETKLDGERAQLHKDGDNYRWWSRNSNEYTGLYGSTKNVSLASYIHGCFNPKVNSCILDGELLAFIPETGAFEGFGNLKTAANRFNMEGEKAESHPCLVVFDVLMINGRNVDGDTLAERYSILEMIIPNPRPSYLQILEHQEGKTTADVVAGLDTRMAEHAEGIVIKDPESKYILNDRTGPWLKVKPDYIDALGDDVDLVLVGGFYGSGRRGGKLSHFMCAVVDDTMTPPRYISFCKFGSGYTYAEIDSITHEREGQWQRYDPRRPPAWLVHPPYSKEKPDMILHPDHSRVVCVKGAEIVPSDQYSAGWTLRFPRFVRLRPDKSVDQAMSRSELDAYIQRNKGRMQSRRGELEEGGEEGALVRRTPARGGRVAASVAAERKFDARGLEKVSGTFEGVEVCVELGAVKKREGGGSAKDELERLVHMHGGTVVQNAKYGRTNYVIADEMIYTVTTKKESFDIVKSKWIYDCINARRVLPLQPNALPSTKTAFRDSNDRYGDSYTEDVTPESLKELFDSMPDMESNRLRKRKRFKEEGDDSAAEHEAHADALATQRLILRVEQGRHFESNPTLGGLLRRCVLYLDLWPDLRVAPEMLPVNDDVPPEGVVVLDREKWDPPDPNASVALLAGVASCWGAVVEGRITPVTTHVVIARREDRGAVGGGDVERRMKEVESKVLMKYPGRHTRRFYVVDSGWVKACVASERAHQRAQPPAPPWLAGAPAPSMLSSTYRVQPVAIQGPDTTQFGTVVTSTIDPVLGTAPSQYLVTASGVQPLPGQQPCVPGQPVAVSYQPQWLSQLMASAVANPTLPALLQPPAILQYSPALDVGPGYRPLWGPQQPWADANLLMTMQKMVKKTAKTAADAAVKKALGVFHSRRSHHSRGTQEDEVANDEDEDRPTSVDDTDASNAGGAESDRSRCHRQHGFHHHRYASSKDHHQRTPSPLPRQQQKAKQQRQTVTIVMDCDATGREMSQVATGGSSDAVERWHASDGDGKPILVRRRNVPVRQVLVVDEEDAARRIGDCDEFAAGGSVAELGGISEGSAMEATDRPRRFLVARRGVNGVGKVTAFGVNGEGATRREAAVTSAAGFREGLVALRSKDKTAVPTVGGGLTEEEKCKLKHEKLERMRNYARMGSVAESPLLQKPISPSADRDDMPPYGGCQISPAKVPALDHHQTPPDSSPPRLALPVLNGPSLIASHLAEIERTARTAAAVMTDSSATVPEDGPDEPSPAPASTSSTSPASTTPASTAASTASPSPSSHASSLLPVAALKSAILPLPPIPPSSLANEDEARDPKPSAAPAAEDSSLTHDRTSPPGRPDPPEKNPDDRPPGLADAIELSILSRTPATNPDAPPQPRWMSGLPSTTTNLMSTASPFVITDPMPDPPSASSVAIPIPSDRVPPEEGAGREDEDARNLLARIRRRVRVRSRMLAEVPIRYDKGKEFFSDVIPEDLEGILPNVTYRSRIQHLNAGLATFRTLKDYRAMIRSVSSVVLVALVLSLLITRAVLAGNPFNGDGSNNGNNNNAPASGDSTATPPPQSSGASGSQVVLASGILILATIMLAVFTCCFLLRPFRPYELIRYELAKWNDEDQRLRLVWRQERRGDVFGRLNLSPMMPEWLIIVEQRDRDPNDPIDGDEAAGADEWNLPTYEAPPPGVDEFVGVGPPPGEEEGEADSEAEQIAPVGDEDAGEAESVIVVVEREPTGEDEEAVVVVVEGKASEVERAPSAGTGANAEVWSGTTVLSTARPPSYRSVDLRG